jgi:hypothetical protein
MKRVALRVVIAAALVGTGWTAAKASQSQPPQVPDFEIRVTSANSHTRIECLRGCRLQWVEREVPDRQIGQPSFEWGPIGAPSGRLGGWIAR